MDEKKTKICNKCKKDKPIREFSHNKSRGDGLQKCCKKCNKQYKDEHKKEYKKYCKNYYIQRAKEIKANIKKRRKEHPEYDTEYRKVRKAEDLGFKIRCNLRTRLNKAIINNQKSGSAVRDLGISIEGFKLYLEGLFEPWMRWNNYGKYDLNRKTWQLGHIIPLAAFDLTNRQDFMRAVHYSNIRPQLAEENISKGSLYNGIRYRSKNG